MSDEERKQQPARSAATFVATWRDYDDEAIRTCDWHLPTAIRDLYSKHGHQFSVEVHPLNADSGFPCELEEEPTDLEKWAVTQPPENFLNILECRHEVDTPEEHYLGEFLNCSVHGDQMIIDHANPSRS